MNIKDKSIDDVLAEARAVSEFGEFKDSGTLYTEKQVKAVEIIDNVHFVFVYLDAAPLNDHTKTRIGTGVLDAAIAKLQEVLF